MAFIKDERVPIEELESLLPKSIISSVNACEVATVLTRLEIPQHTIGNIIEETIGEIIPFTKEQSIIAAGLWEKTKVYGLSLGDRACLALALDRKLPIYTADKIWKKLKIESLEINLIR